MSSGGYIDFTGRLPLYPDANAISASGKAVCAPFWSATDGRLGQVYYSVRTNTTTLDKVKRDLAEFDPLNAASFNPTLALVVTWVHMQSLEELPGVSDYYELRETLEPDGVS